MTNKYANDNAQEAGLREIEEIFIQARYIEESNNKQKSTEERELHEKIVKGLRSGEWSGRDVFMLHMSLDDTEISKWTLLLFMYKNLKKEFTASDYSKLGMVYTIDSEKLKQRTIRDIKTAIEALYEKGSIYGDTLCDEIVDYLADEKLPMPNFQQDEIYILANSYSAGSEAIHKASVASQQKPKPKGLER